MQDAQRLDAKLSKAEATAILNDCVCFLSNFANSKEEKYQEVELETDVVSYLFEALHSDIDLQTQLNAVIAIKNVCFCRRGAQTVAAYQKFTQVVYSLLSCNY